MTCGDDYETASAGGEFILSISVPGEANWWRVDWFPEPPCNYMVFSLTKKIYLKPHSCCRTNLRDKHLLDPSTKVNKIQEGVGGFQPRRTCCVTLPLPESACHKMGLKRFGQNSAFAVNSHRSSVKVPPT